LFVNTSLDEWELAQVKKELLLKQGRERQAHGQTAPGKTLLSTIDKSDTHNTQKEIAQELEIPLRVKNELGRTRIELEKKKRELIEQMFPKGRHNQYTAK